MPTQSEMRFTFGPASGVAFEVIEFDFLEELSRPFVLTLDLSSTDPAIDFGQILDQPALFTIWRGGQPVRYVHGLVSAFEQGETGFRRSRYRATIEPTLARTALCSDWRIFQLQTVPQILQTVLKTHGIIDYEQILTREHLPREYCVQPGETDLDFLARLAAEEGFYYAFAHGARGHQLIHGDRIYVHGAIDGGPVTYHPNPGGNPAGPCLRTFRYTEQVRTARTVQRDYSFKHPRYDQQHTSDGSHLDHQGRDYENYHFPGRYKTDAAGKPFTATRLSSLRRDAQTAEVEGDDARLVPGLAFDLVGHPREEWNRGWRPVRVHHHGVQHTSQQEESADAARGTHYGYTATLIPDRVDWKAPLLPKPRIDGPQMATVVGPPGEEIYCDEYGRVIVQFPWDREGKNNEHSSCWIRVAQNWAGATRGHMAIPRIGQEVIVSYQDGDCDQPVITGRTHSALTLPPYELPRHKTRMTIRSQTHKGNGFNELRFEDEAGQEEIDVHAQKDRNIHVNHDETTFVGNDRREDVEHDETIAIGHDRTEIVGNDEQVNIGHDRRHTIGRDAFLTIERNHTIGIGKDRIEQVGNHRKDQTTANHLIDVGGHVEHTVQGHHKLSAGQSIERQTKLYQLQVGDKAELRGPGGTITIDDSGVTLEGIAIHFTGRIEQDACGGAAAMARRLAVARAPYPMQVDCAAWLAAGATALVGASSGGQGASAPGAPSPSGASPIAAPLQDAGPSTASAPASPTPSSGSTPAPVSCQWHLANIGPLEKTMSMEAADYFMVDMHYQLMLDDHHNPQLMRFGNVSKTFELRYDDTARDIVATLRIAIKPMEVRVRANANAPFEMAPNGRYATVPYFSDTYHVNYQADPAQHPTNPVCPRHPLAPPPDIAKLREQAESVLNANHFKLTRADCAQGDACGCRVPVRFVVQVVDPHQAHAPTPHATINVYEQTLRADSANWGEVTVTRNDQQSDCNAPNYYLPHPQDHVVAHEAGHLFSWPDEYYDNGGAVHRDFIVNQHVSPDRVQALAGKPRWQAYTSDTLMGYGANSGAGIRTYYLERIATWFETQNGHPWRVVS